MRIACFPTMLTLVLSLLGSSICSAQTSGFLDSYPTMAPDPERPGSMNWLKPGVDLRNYDRILLDEITIFISPSSKYKGLSPSRMQAIADNFRAVMVDTLEPDYPVVSKPGPRVILLRLAISDVTLKKKPMSVLNLVPIGAAIRVTQEATGATVLLDGATLEGEMLDSQSSDRIGVLLDRQPGASGSEEASWDTLTQSLRFYATRLRARLGQGR